MENKRLVLIIEDNEDFQNLYGMVAEQAGFTVERLYNGSEALQRLEREPLPTLVLLDSRLPVAEGDVILAAARSKEEWVHVPIFILTADTRVSKKYGNLSPDAPHPDGVIEKGADSIRQLRELFRQY